MFTFSWYGASCSAAQRLPGPHLAGQEGSDPSQQPHWQPQPCPAHCSHDPWAWCPPGAAPAQPQLCGKPCRTAGRIASTGRVLPPLPHSACGSLSLPRTLCTSRGGWLPLPHRSSTILSAPHPSALSGSQCWSKGLARSQGTRLPPHSCLHRQGCRQDAVGRAALPGRFSGVCRAHPCTGAMAGQRGSGPGAVRGPARHGKC